jgi:fructosamine-3-kinase
MDLPEVEALQYLASHTKILVPKIYAVHIDDGLTYIEVEYIPGNTLQAACKGLSRD